MAQTPRRSARDAVLTELRRQIVDSTRSPGSVLSEKDLIEELGVSRTPIRESLILLAEEGLVQVFPQLGTFVSRISVTRVNHSQFVREALELASLKDYVPTEGAMSSLDENLAAQHRAVTAADHDAFLALDDEFHRTLMELAGRGSAWREVSAAKVHMDRVRRLSLPRPNALVRLVGEHHAIVDALREGDVDGALLALHGHLTTVFADLDEIRTEHPELFVEHDDARPVRTVSTRLV